MKNIYLIIVMCITVLILSSCMNNDKQLKSTENIKNFEDISFKYSNDVIERDYGIDYAKEYGINYGVEPIIYTFFDMVDKKATFNIIIEKLSDGLTLDSYIKTTIIDKGYEYDSIETIKINNIEWAEIVYKDKDKIKNERISIINNKAYIVTYESSLIDYDKNINILNNIMKTISINKK